MSSLTGHSTELLALGLVLFVILRSFPKLIAVPAVIALLAAVFPNDRLVQILLGLVEKNIGVIVLLALGWYWVSRLLRALAKIT